MKKILIILFLFAVIIGCRDLDDIIDGGNEDPTPDISLDQGLIAYWSFDDGSALDFSGNGNDGRIMNDVFPVRGVSGQALYLQGNGYNASTGGHIIIPTFNFARMPEFSISMWVNETALTTSTTGQGEAYIAFGDHNYGSLHIFNTKNQAVNDQTLYIHFGVGTVFNNLTPPYEVIDPIYFPFDTGYRNNWMHYSLVYTNGTMYAYVNGRLIGSERQEVRITGDFAAMGRHWWEGGAKTSTRFQGALDEVRIYNRALSQSDILELNNFD